MRFSFSDFKLLGNLTIDPEVKGTQSQTLIANVGIAVSHRVKKGEEWEDQPHFFYFKAFGKLAEHIKANMKKGDKCLVEGRIHNNQWTDQQGVKKSRIELIADNVISFSSRKNTSTTPKQSEGEADTTIDDFPDREEAVNVEETKNDEVVSPDDIPF